MCDRSTGCPTIANLNQNCYRAQCYASARAIVKKLQLEHDQYSIAFQSRLGKLAWIQPYVTEHIEALAAKGIKRLSIACPSFFCDCLETLDEIGNELREQWIDLGGESLQLIPCLNDSSAAIDFLEKLIQQ